MAANDILVKIGADITQFSKAMAQSQRQLADFSKANKNTFDAFKKTGDALTKSITTPALVATSALAGVTLVKGFGRLMGIDTARAKLGALGHDAESVETIMDNALESVKGTSYGLDEAATIAANAVAAGIDPGKELAKYLTLTGDAAAIAGTDLNEMGSIFNRVETAQRAYTTELNMLADRGIPIYQWLADEAGVSAEAVRDMAAAGEVSSEMYFDAIEKNIGGAAKTIGETSFAAALQNIWSDIARIGANFLDAGGEGQGFFSTLKPLLTEFRGYLSTVEEGAAQLGTKFGEAFTNMIETIRDLKARYDELSPAMQDFIKKAAGFGAVFLVAIGPILKFIGFIPSLIAGFSTIVTAVKAAGTALMFFTSPIGMIILAVAGLAYIIYKYWDEIKAFTVETWEAVSAFLSGLWSTITEGAVAVWEGLGNFFSGLWSSITEGVTVAWTAISEFFTNLWTSIIEGAIAGWTAFYETVVAIITPAIEFFTTLFSGLGESLATIWDGIKLYFSGVWELIKNIFLGAILLIVNLVTGNFEELASNASQIWDNVKNALSNIWDGIKKVFSGALDFIATYLGNVWSAVTNVTSAVWNGIKSFFSSLWDGIKNVFSSALDGIKNTVSTIFNGVSDFISTVWNGIKTFFSQTLGEIGNTVKQKFDDIKSAISDKMTEAKETIENIWDGVMGFFKGIDLRQIGKDVIDGLINGIKSKVKAVGDAVKSVTDSITGKIKGILGIKSPSRVLAQIGRWTGEGLANGIEDTTKMVDRASDMLGEAAIPDKRVIDMSYATPSGVRSSLTSAVNGSVDVNTRDDVLAGAISELRRDLTNLRVEMEGETVGRLVTPHVNGKNAIDSSVRRYF